MISVIVPTYKRPEALDLCLESAIRGQDRINQLLVVVDGFYELNKEVLQKYRTSIDVLNLEQNVGLCKGTNFGVYNAKNRYILVVNDDNVFPQGWDTKLLEDFRPGTVLTPNQIEPNPSIFSQFHHRDLGRDPKQFDLEAFLKYEKTLSQNKLEHAAGGTLPFLMEKEDYMRVGGWDENYPMGLTADWDFFYKCQLSGLDTNRTYKVHFYHFESLSTRKTPQISKVRDQYEIQATHYAIYKWGGPILNESNNQKYIGKI